MKKYVRRGKYARRQKAANPATPNERPKRYKGHDQKDATGPSKRVASRKRGKTLARLPQGGAA